MGVSWARWVSVGCRWVCVGPRWGYVGPRWGPSLKPAEIPQRWAVFSRSDTPTPNETQKPNILRLLCPTHSQHPLKCSPTSLIRRRMTASPLRRVCMPSACPPTYIHTSLRAPRTLFRVGLCSKMSAATCESVPVPGGK